MKFIQFAAICLLLTVPSFGQSSFERIVIPTVAQNPIPGAFGSQWVTEISGRYVGWDRLALFTPVCVSGITCVYRDIPAHTTFGFAALTTGNSPNGAVIKTRPGYAKDTLLSVRVRDLSRTFETWGTEIPVARESEATGTPITLLNLPTDDTFRVTIRMYDFDLPHNTFIISVLPLHGDDAPLAEIKLPSALLRDSLGLSQGLNFAVLGDLPPLEPDPPDRVRVLVRTETPTRFWAFAAVTNNETQHVTAIRPTRPAAMP